MSDLMLRDLAEADALPAVGECRRCPWRGTLAAEIAHELRNALCVMSSSLQFLHRRLAAESDPAGDVAMTALQSLERMQGLLREMLECGGFGTPRFCCADLNELITEVLGMISSECARCGISVDVALDPSLPRVWVQTPRVRQILLNLVRNSLEAMVESGNVLMVRSRIAPDHGQAIVEIANNGPPIHPDVLRDLFRPFHTTKPDGTGLGLYLSRKIARDHGGDLAVENLRNGVRFALALPSGRPERGDDGAHPDRGR